MYSCSPTLSQISLKNSFGKVVFQILAKIEMMGNKNRLFGRHFETVQHVLFFFLFLCRILISYSLYMVQISLQIRLGKWFSTVGSLGTPLWAPTGAKIPWSLKC